MRYEALPTIEDGILSLEGTIENGVSFRRKRDLGVQVYFDPPPHPLTRDQLSRTYCYGSGLRVAVLREPLTGGSFCTTTHSTYNYSPCPDPYDVPATAPGPRSAREADRFWEEAYSASKLTLSRPIRVPWITAREWRVSGDSFAVKADLSRVIERHGEGIYTLLVWAKPGGEEMVISQYSMFYAVSPPDTYSSN